MFDFKNISQGMLKFISLMALIIFGVIYFTGGKPEYYAFPIIGIIILIISLGYSRNPDYISVRPEKEARKIGNEYIKNNIGMHNEEYNLDLPDGKIGYDAFKKHDEREGFLIPFYEMGFHIYDKTKNYSRYFTISIHGLREDLGIMDLTEIDHPYKGERYRIKYVLVDSSDSEKYSKASLMVYNWNKKEGFE